MGEPEHAILPDVQMGTHFGRLFRSQNLFVLAKEIGQEEQAGYLPEKFDSLLSQIVKTKPLDDCSDIRRYKEIFDDMLPPDAAAFLWDELLFAKEFELSNSLVEVDEATAKRYEAVRVQVEREMKSHHRKKQHLIAAFKRQYGIDATLVHSPELFSS